MIIDNAGVDRAALRGKVAVVTGAGRGIGRETARVLAHLGAAVVIAEIDPNGLDTERAIRAEGGQALFVQTDIADAAPVDKLHAKTLAAFGRTHILINNAEAFRAKPLLEHTVSEWDQVFAVNLRGAFLCIKAFLPEMLQAKDGVIVTMNSADGMPYLSAYLASKVGLASLARSLAAEVGAADGTAASGVSVYCCGPGMVDTPGIRKAVPLLAPLYGVSEAEFIRESAPGGELWPAELAATGLVGSVLHARALHGQEISGFVGLQQLGLNAKGERFVPEGAAASNGAAPGNGTTPGNGAAQPTAMAAENPAALAAPEGHFQKSIRLNRELEAMLRANQREYDELSMFQRPIVKRMFQQGTGLKLEEWLAAARQMTAELEGAQAAPAAVDSYCARLERLEKFLVKQEGDARGYFKEPDRLKAALEALQQRQSTVLKLRAALAALAQL